MKSLIISILILSLLSCKNKQAEPIKSIKKGSDLIRSIKTWYGYNLPDLSMRTFVNDTIVRFSDKLYNNFNGDLKKYHSFLNYQIDHYYDSFWDYQIDCHYKFKDDSLICDALGDIGRKNLPVKKGSEKLGIYFYGYKVNQDSLCLYMKGKLVEVFYSHKKYGKY